MYWDSIATHKMILLQLVGLLLDEQNTASPVQNAIIARPARKGKLIASFSMTLGREHKKAPIEKGLPSKWVLLVY